MPNFQVSIQSSGVESVAVGASYITVGDYSNYLTSDEVGHLQSDFSDYYKVMVSSTVGDYSFSSTGDGDATIETPDQAASSPITSSIPNLGDAKYTLTVIAVPTWRDDVIYLEDQHVYYLGSIYIADNPSGSADKNPVDNPSEWTEVAEADISTKYRVDYNFINQYSIEKYFAENTKLAVADQVNGVGKDFQNNPYWEKAAKLDNILSALSVYSDDSDWDTCDYLIAHSKTIIDG